MPFRWLAVGYVIFMMSALTGNMGRRKEFFGGYEQEVSHRCKRDNYCGDGSWGHGSKEYA